MERWLHISRRQHLKPRDLGSWSQASFPWTIRFIGRDSVSSSVKGLSVKAGGVALHVNDYGTRHSSTLSFLRRWLPLPGGGGCRRRSLVPSGPDLEWLPFPAKDISLTAVNVFCLRQSKDAPLPFVIFPKLFMGKMKAAPAPTNGTRTLPMGTRVGGSRHGLPRLSRHRPGLAAAPALARPVYLSSSGPGRRERRRERGPPCAEVPPAGSALLCRKADLRQSAVEWRGHRNGAFIDFWEH